jgi:hypothetical protein
MKVEFGVGLGSGPPLLGSADVPRFVELVRRAEGYGAAAIGLRPSNPLTREPQVMASFLAWIEQLADAGAIRLWIGFGGADLERQLRDLALFGEHVMPRFAS